MPAPDPALNVTGATAIFPCVDVKAVDVHLAELRKKIRNVRTTGKYPALICQYRDDLDLLLERRLLLTSVEVTA